VSVERKLAEDAGSAAGALSVVPGPRRVGRGGLGLVFPDPATPGLAPPPVIPPRRR
jgi:hypothetical protein